MNKRILVLVSIVICMLFSLFTPLKVNAVDSDETDENAIVDNIPNDNEKEEVEKLNPEDTNSEDEVNLENSILNAPKDEILLNDMPSEVLEEENPDEEKDDENEENEEPSSNIESGEIYDIQKVKVIITKVDEEGNQLAGASLQIIDGNDKVWDEWTSDGSAHETLLPDGTYFLRELEAPEGYDKAEDKEFTVKVEIADISAGVDYSTTPCPHYEGTPLYYVEIEGKKHEVYCINQDWETPDANSEYDGEILDAPNIRDFTQQTVYIDAEKNTEKKDISDQTLTDQELYDKILDIIYHRNTAKEDFDDLTEAEIRYVTESALKNYTNAGLTRVSLGQNFTVREYTDGSTTTTVGTYHDTNIEELEAIDRPYYAKVTSTKTYDNYTQTSYNLFYLNVWYRDFVYDPDEPDLYRVEVGKGDAFGTLARHWGDKKGHYAGDASEKAKVKAQVARYYDLYQYLIGKTNDTHHPEDMHLYIYATENLRPDDTSSYDFDEGAYQNLLGVTGYFEDVKQQEMNVEMVNNYSTEKTSVKVTKVWGDENNESKKRPEEVTVTLLADGKDYEEVVLSEGNEWQYEFTDLPVYSMGEKIEWYVREENVPEGYVAAIEVDGTKGFIIHNVLGQGDHEPPHDNPQTGDNIVLYLITFMISIIGFASGKQYLKENS